MTLSLEPTAAWAGGTKPSAMAWRRVGEKPPEVTTPMTAPAAPSAAAPQPDQFLQYASARRLDRFEQERALVDMVLRGPEEPDRTGSKGVAGSLFSAEMLRVLSDARHGRGQT